MVPMFQGQGHLDTGDYLAVNFILVVTLTEVFFQSLGGPAPPDLWAWESVLLLGQILLINRPEFFSRFFSHSEVFFVHFTRQYPPPPSVVGLGM